MISFRSASRPLDGGSDADRDGGCRTKEQATRPPGRIVTAVTEHRDKVAPQIRSRRAHLNGHGASLRTVPLPPIADLYSDGRMMGP